MKDCGVYQHCFHQIGEKERHKNGKYEPDGWHVLKICCVCEKLDREILWT